MNKKAEELLLKNNGILRTVDALAVGVSKDHLYRFIRTAGLQKVAHGIYVTNDTFHDEMYLLQAQFPRAIFSHEAALYLHELAEREPMPLAVTVPASYNSGGLKKQGVKVYYIKNEWYDLGITERVSFGGHIIRLYDMERTICDIVRRYDEMDIAVFNYAATEYVKRKNKNYSKLSSYAAILGIERKLREKMGVLF